jgi:hypothetical protein
MTQSGRVAEKKAQLECPVYSAASAIAGNAVVLDLGGEQFAYYAHLQPGSVQVKA